MSSPELTRRALRSSTKKAQNKVSDVESSFDGSDEESKKENQQKHQIIGEDECDSGKQKRKGRSKGTQQQPAKAQKAVQGNAGKKTTAGTNRLPKKGNTLNKQQGTQMHIFCVTCVIVVVAFIVIAYVAKTNSRHVLSAQTRQDAFISKLEDLRKKFPSQSKRFWSVVGAAPMSHLQSGHSPERPVVLMLVGQPGKAATTACIANHLGDLYTEALGGPSHGIEPVPINGSDFTSADADETKLKIDDKLSYAFEDGSKAAVVHHFDKLPACSILLFHSYCENDNAPYKDVAIILTLELDESAARDTPPTDIDNLVDRHVTKRWLPCPDLQRGKIEAMLSRVANNVALITKELHVDMACPA